MFCPRCSDEIPSGSRFCPSCGAPVSQPTAASTDSDLEALAAAGDREAFAELYERHFDHVYDFLRRMVRDPDEAADLAQETFLRAMRALSPKEKKAAFSTWLFTIARNLALKRLERQRRIATTAEREAEEEETVLYGRVDPDRYADPQAALEAQELSGLVWQAAGALSPKEYSLLDLQVRHGLDSAEIAQVLGVSKGNAYTMISRLKDSFESAVATLQLLQRGRKECPELSRLLEEHRITFISPQARRLIDRHVAQCPTCQEQRRRLVSPTAIFGSFAAVPVPLGLKPHIAEALVGSWAQASREAAGGLKGFVSQTATRVTSLPTAWKAAIISGLLLVAVGGGLGGWVGVGGGLLVFGGGEGEDRADVLPAAALPSPTPSLTPSPAPTSTPTPVVSAPTQTPKPCPVADATFCDFVYQIDAALARGDFSSIVVQTEFTEHTCGYFTDLEGPPLQGFAPSVCEGKPRDAVPECVDWTSTGGAHPYYGCLTKDEYVQQLTSVPYTPTEASQVVAVIGINFGCADSACQGTLVLRDPAERLSGDPQNDSGVFLTVVRKDSGWRIGGGGCCLPFLYGGYPEFPWPPE